MNMNEIHEIELKNIIFDEQNRSTEKEIRNFNTKSLAESMREYGQITPIIVKPIEDGKFLLVAGERRCTALKLIKSKTVKAIFTENDDVDSIRALENAQRKSLHPMDEALEMRRLSESSKTMKEISLIYGISESLVQKRMVLCNLIADIQTDFKKKKLSAVDAYAIAREEIGCQTEIHEKCSKSSKYDSATVKSIIEGHHCNLETATFDTSDCTQCPYNSDNKNLLFDELKCGHCLKAECFREKTDFYTQEKIRQLRDEGVDVALISSSHYLSSDNDTYEGEKILAQSSFKLVETAEEGSRPAILVDGKEKGKLCYIIENEIKAKTPKSAKAEDNETEEETAEEEEEKREELKDDENVRKLVIETKKKIFNKAIERLENPSDKDMDFLLDFLKGIVRPSYTSVEMLKTEADKKIGEVTKVNPLGVMIFQQLIDNMDSKFIPTKKKIFNFFKFLGIDSIKEYEESMKSLSLEGNENIQLFMKKAVDVSYKEDTEETPF